MGEGLIGEGKCDCSGVERREGDRESIQNIYTFVKFSNKKFNRVVKNASKFLQVNGLQVE